MIDVDEHTRAGRVRSGDQRGQLWKDLAGIKDDLRDDDEIGASARRGKKVVRGELSVLPRFDERQRDAPAARVVAQDHVDRIELAACRYHTRYRAVAVEHCAQTLPRARLGHDAIVARRPEKSREARAMSAHLVKPRVPRIAQALLPLRK